MSVGKKVFTQFSGSDQGIPQSLAQIDVLIGTPLPAALAGLLEGFSGPIWLDSGPQSEVGVRCKTAPDFSVDGFLPLDLFFGRNSGRNGLSSVFLAYQNRLSDGSVPIALVAGDNLVVWSKMDQAVYFWDHEGPGEENSPDAVTHIADSVEDLLERLEERPIAKSDKPKIVRSNFNF